MTDNYTGMNEPIITEATSEALKSFVPEIFISRLIVGTIRLLLYYLQKEQDREHYVDDYLHDVERLLEFLEVLREEYEPAFAKDDDLVDNLHQTIAQNKQQIAQLENAKNGLAQKFSELANRYTDLVLDKTRDSK